MLQIDATESNAGLGKQTISGGFQLLEFVGEDTKETLSCALASGVGAGDDAHTWRAKAYA